MVEDGLASKTMAAYIDLNPVRAGMVADPAEYRWGSYGEAMGATGKSGAKAKAGLVRAIMAEVRRAGFQHRVLESEANPAGKSQVVSVVPALIPRPRQLGRFSICVEQELPIRSGAAQ